MPSLTSRLLRALLRLVLIWFAAVVAAGLIALTMLAVVASLTISLVTGKKASPGAVFGRFRRHSTQGIWPDRKSATARGEEVDVASSRLRKASGPVVDVEAREIPAQKPPV